MPNPNITARLLRHGPQGLSDTELLAALLDNLPDPLNTAEAILQACRGLGGLAHLNLDSLSKIASLDESARARLLAAIEIGQRIVRVIPDPPPRISGADDAIHHLHDMRHLAQEHVRVLLLDSQEHLIGIETLYIGTVNITVLRIAEVFRPAILRNCPALLLAHNHPMGEAVPSPEDIEMTRDLIAAGKLLDIRLVDHLIISPLGWTSLRRSGFGFEDA
jgi:DNA repair protein RadC